MLTTRERIANLESPEARRLLTDLADALGEAFAYPSELLPRSLRGKGKTTTLSTIESKVQEEEWGDTFVVQEEDPVKVIKERNLQVYAQTPEGEDIPYSPNQDLVDAAYVRLGKALGWV